MSILKKLVIPAIVIGILLFWGLAGPGFLNAPRPRPSASAEILVVEGWLSEPLLQKAAELIQQHPYRHVIITGVTISDAIEMLYRGSLIMKPRESIRIVKEDSIGLKLSGTRALQQYPEGKLLINDTPVGNFTASRGPSWVFIKSTSVFDSVFSISLTFDNDACTRYADRNLYVHGIKIHGREMLPRTLRTCYIRYLEGVADTIDLNFTTIPGQAAWFLHKFGVPENRVSVVSVNGIRKDKTWHSMMALAEYAEKEYPEVHSVDIFTHPFHGRRTLIQARRAFSPETTLQVIPAANIQTWWKNGRDMKMFLKESAGLFYALFYNP